MKVLVTVKEVAEVGDDFEIEGTRISENHLEYTLNEWDEYSIEAAVQLAEAGIVDEVVAVTIGPPRVEETIRIALAKGADRAVRIWDDEFEGIDLLDANTKADLLSAVVLDEDPDLILTGVQANDDSFGATGVTLAQQIGFGWAAVVAELEINDDEGVAHVRRELEGGVEELTDVEFPAVLTIQTGINDPRYASLRGIRQAQRKEIAHQTLDDLGLDASALESDIALTAMYEPETENEATYFEGDAAEQAIKLMGVLREKGVVGGE